MVLGLAGSAGSSSLESFSHSVAGAGVVSKDFCVAVIWVQDMIHKVQGKMKTLALCSVIIKTSKIAESFRAGNLGIVHELYPYKAHPVWSAVGSATK